MIRFFMCPLEFPLEGSCKVLDAIGLAWKMTRDHDAADMILHITTAT